MQNRLRLFQRLKYLFVCVFYSTVLAQPPEILWSWSSHIEDRSTGLALIEIDDATFVAAGGIFPNTGSSGFVVALNLQGDSLWTRSLGQSDSVMTVYGLSSSSNNEIYACGKGRTTLGSIAPIVLKMDYSGNVLWRKVFVNSRSGFSILATTEGGCLFVASSFSNLPAILYRLNSNGDSLWSNSYGTSTINYYTDIRSTPDSGFILFGSTWDFELALQLSLMKLNEEGDTIWHHTYGDSNSDWCAGVDICPDGGYVMAGSRESLDGSEAWDVMVIKTDSNGVEEWRRYFGAGAGVCDDIRYVGNDRIVLAGSVQTTLTTPPDAWILCLGANGDSLWSLLYGHENTENAIALIEDSEGSLAFTGYSQGYESGGNNLFVTRTNGLSSSITIPDIHYDVLTDIQNYPNPFNSNTIIRFNLSHAALPDLTIVNILGKKIIEMPLGYCGKGEHFVSVNLTTFPSGVYFYSVGQDNLTIWRSMLLVR